jgi:integrase
MPDGGIRKVGNQKLSVRQIDTFIARHKAGTVKPRAKLSDGDGMYLTITPAGTPVWRVKFRHAGVESTYSIGPYPEISLSHARVERDRVRAHLRDGRNPLQARNLERAAAVAASGNTFETIAREWLGQHKRDWSAVHYGKSERAIERDVLPELGDLPIAEIRPAMVTKVIETIAARGAVDTARKVRQHMQGIFRLAQAKGLCHYKENPADPAREVLPRRSQQRRRPAFLTWVQLGDVLRKAELARLSPVVRLAHRLCAFTACVRISNIVEAEWQEFDLDGERPIWVIPRTKMKARDRIHDHKVYLGPTIAAELRAWRSRAGSRGYLFPSPTGGKHITRESLEKVYRVTLGLEDQHTPHGWRSALSTLAREEGGFERDVVELALDHIHDNDVVRAYDRGERLEQRLRLMQWWDSGLARAELGANVIPLKREVQRKAP